MISIIDYGIGNLGSIRNMLKRIGVPSETVHSPDQVRNAEKLLLPGVGAFDAGMRSLVDSGMLDALNQRVNVDRKPILGICLGMQLMTQSSEEGQLQGLGWIAARTRRFDAGPSGKLKIPHMGWTDVAPAKASPLITDYPQEARFYCVHSYYVRCEDPQDSLLKGVYGSTPFDAAFQHDNIFGVQFHPEKSHRYGMWLLKNFAERC